MKKIVVAATLAIAVAASALVSAQGQLPPTVRFCAYYCVTYMLQGEDYEPE